MITASLLAIALSLTHAHAPSQRELNGFFLGQHEEVVTNTLEKAFQTDKTPEGDTIKVYALDPDTKSFMAFTYYKDAPETIAAIQITGEKGTDMYPFSGLELGDSRSKVLKTLGEPDDEADMEDIPGKFLTYSDRNYSVELDEKGRLSSIRIGSFRGFEEYEKQRPDWEMMKTSLEHEDVDKLLDVLTPDVEIYRGDKETLGFTLPARMELSDTDSPMYKIFFDEGSGIRALLGQDKLEREEGIRFTDKKLMLMFAKYPKSKSLKEVVYKWQAGKWRIWEIWLAA